jgi:hypothetical protein
MPITAPRRPLSYLHVIEQGNARPEEGAMPTTDTQTADTTRVAFAAPRPSYERMVEYWEYVEQRLAELRACRVRRH